MLSIKVKFSLIAGNANDDDDVDVAVKGDDVAAIRANQMLKPKDEDANVQLRFLW